MRLVKLSANKASFRPVTFKPTGLSLVVAEQKSEKSSQTATYNGVGKSLMLELLHFCLGSNKNTGFAQHLIGWIFSLTINVEGKEHTITRQADKPGEITLDGESITLRKLKDQLENWCFEAEGELGSHLSFRSIVSRFIRSGRAAYVEFAFADKGEAKKPYGAMLASAFLLGLDLALARKKYDLRSRQESLRDTMKKLESDPLFAQLLAQDTLDIELTALQEEAAKLDADLRAFKVADDYHEIEKEANRTKRQLTLLRRDSIKLSEGIAQIDRSLKTRDDLPVERVFRMYEEAQTALPESVQKRVEDVVEFHKELQTKRIYRLTQERQNLEREHSESVEQIAAMSAELDRQLGYLGDHRALDDYVAVNSELSRIQQKISRLKESKALRDKVERERRRIERDLADENIRTDNYLEAARALVSEATGMFRSYARELYGSRPSGLSIANDDGLNQLRYRIDAHITADAAEGINEAKIFCFDMTLLALRRGHRFRFLVHDSTLYSAVDPRQRFAMLRIANRICEQLGFQYVAALNMHDITSIREQVPASDDVQTVLGETNVVLRLTDEAASQKLLGIEVDMDYTK